VSKFVLFHVRYQWSVPVSRPDKPVVYPSFVDRGINSTSSHCRMLSGNHNSVVLNAGPIVLLMNLRYCTIVNSRRCLTNWFQSRPSPVVDDRRIPGLSPQETCSATTRTYRQFLSNSGVCVSVDEGTSYLPQFTSKHARVLLDAEDRRRKVFSTSTVAFNRCTHGPRWCPIL